MSATPTFGRYTEIPVDQMTAEQREGYRFLVDGPRGRLPGPYKVWVHNPKLVRAAAPLGHESMTDMIVLMGYYTAVSLTRKSI
jgi:4-carboxymuconolactone decarboxylase